MSSDMRDTAGREGLRRTRTRSRLGFFAGTALAISTLLLAAGSNAAVIATAAGVVPAATGELGGTRVTILQGAQLEEGQLIVTDAGGEVQVTFVDNTRMVIGPNSSLQIDRILMRNDGTFSAFAVNALGGTFRFITGNSPSDVYRVTTPAGTISVRGTKWDLTILPLLGPGNVPVWVANAMVYIGAISMCPFGMTQCLTLNDHCEVGNMMANAAATIMATWRARERFASQTFPYAVFQNALFLINQIDNAEDCADEEMADAGAGADEGGGSPGGNNNNPPDSGRPNDCPSFGNYVTYETSGPPASCIPPPPID
jgi:hypothetical protein